MMIQRINELVNDISMMLIKPNSFTDDEKYAIKLLFEMNQEFMFKDWDQASVKHKDKKRLLSQVIKLDKQYPGGLKQYYANALKLVSDSVNNTNPYNEWRVSIAETMNLEFNSRQFNEYESIGAQQFGHCGFILLGGGFGERLGYDGIKTGLPCEIISMSSYIELYIQTLLAFQSRARVLLNRADLLIPFACTTSGIGHDLTKQLLQENNYFGLDETQNQFTLLRQQLVASFANHKCEFALEEKDAYSIIEKPHGHGDVHSLMYQTGTAQKWHQMGVKWLIFLQDTNAVAIRSLASNLGVSEKHNLTMNSVATARPRGQSYGAICKLINKKDSTKQLTVNIEYNQLNALLQDEKSDIESQLVANTNTLIIECNTYCNVLSKSKGMVTEFINPKYENQQKRNKFKSATRLECMMQDYPKLLFKYGYYSELRNIGVTCLPKWIALQPVKKNIVAAQMEAKENENNMSELSASNGEHSIYFCNRKLMKTCGVTFVNGYHENELRMFAGINVKHGAHIVLLPSFGMTFAEIRNRLIGKQNIKITNNSTLLLDGDIIINDLQLNGALIIRVKGKGTKVIINGLKVDNDGWIFQQIDNNNNQNHIDEIYKLRGYTLNKMDARIIQFSDGKEHIISQ